MTESKHKEAVTGSGELPVFYAHNNDFSSTPNFRVVHFTCFYQRNKDVHMASWFSRCNTGCHSFPEMSHTRLVYRLSWQRLTCKQKAITQTGEVEYS